MEQLTSQWQQKINDLAQQYNVSADAVLNLLQAVRNGNGIMAQFSHPEFGSGQWMQGGITTMGDRFNNSLKTTVDDLCLELSNLLINQPVIYIPLSHQSQNQNQQQQQKGSYSDSIINGSNLSAGNWWSSDLGVPLMTGAQNNMRYAYFADINRLAIDINGQVTIFDTLDHQISGVSLQQGASLSVIFTSQYGTVDPFRLPIISSDRDTVSNTTNDMSFETNTTDVQTEMRPPQNSFQPQTDVSSPASVQENDIFATLEKLAQLKQKGIVTEEDFLAKKNELLSRL